jgi:hypothetical protein
MFSNFRELREEEMMRNKSAIRETILIPAT